MLSVENLTCARGGVPILEGVNFDLPKGQALILRGQNGSGKTTLLRTIAGLQPALSGNISVSPESVAYGAHLDGVKSTLTVKENLNFWAGVFGTHIVDQAMKAFEIENLQERFAQNLSAGQKRRLGLARLIVTGRPIWVLDEPTVSLDKESVALFARTISQHLSDGGAALIATHIDLGLDAEILDVSQFKARSTAHLDAFL